MAAGGDRLQGQAALITGASRGIGRASALALARAGANIVGVARDPDGGRLETLRDEIRGLGRVFVSVNGDAREESTAVSATTLAMERFGRIDVLLNNVGIGLYADYTDCTLKDYDDIMDTSMRSTFVFTSAVVPIMKQQGHGLILQIASQAGLRGFTREAIYCAAKHAQVGFTRALRLELQPFGIKVSVICPAGVKTDFALGRGRTPEFVAQSGFLTSEDIADAVLFTACQSSEARMSEIGLISINESL
jgi:NAD(P)-dependent dehydrogenase (short-subunit alcohol dehydrogenase family)